MQPRHTYTYRAGLRIPKVAGAGAAVPSCSYLAVLVRAHQTSIDVDVGVHLDGSNLQTTKQPVSSADGLADGFEQGARKPWPRSRAPIEDVATPCMEESLVLGAW